MTVYVDDMRAPYRGMLMSHMIADTVDELHQMADTVGLKRKWFQNHGSFPHYDLCQAKKKLAVQAGAVEVSQREIVRIGRRLKSGSSAEAAYSLRKRVVVGSSPTSQTIRA